jgi:hypothetical protein
MKKFNRALAWSVFLFAMLPAALPGQQDRFGFLPKKEWFIDSEIPSREPQKAFFLANDKPKEISLYRQQTGLGSFFYFQPVGKLNMVWIGWDDDKDGKDDILEVYTRNQHSYFMLVQPGKPHLLLAGGNRKGEMRYPDHPFVGVWIRGGGISSEVRLVGPGDYRFFMRLTEIRGYGIRKGWYLLKYLGGNIFESDDTFEDGHIRLEVKSEKEMILTPLFTLPKSEGLVEPVRLRARG